jgi:hypothetical protein
MQSNSKSNQAFFRQFLTEVRPYEQALLNHPMYTELTTLMALRTFMQAHVFAVWDNMLLLKTLQQRLTCITTPWLPVEDPIAARLINEIILDEETESVGSGEYLSHAQCYLVAMAEVGAQTQLIEQLMSLLRNGMSLEAALSTLTIAPSISGFVLTTWQICQGPTAGIVAAFLSGGEEISPPMFANLLKQLDVIEPQLKQMNVCCDRLRNYCQHHVSLDEAQHIPIAKRLLNRICGENPEAWQQATDAAIATLRARQRLWNGVLSEVQSAYQPNFVPNSLNDQSALVHAC